MKTQKNTQKKPRKIWRDLLIAIGLLVAFSVLFIAWMGYEGDSTPIKKVADQFKVDSEWKLVNEDVQGSTNFCGAGSCPRVGKWWTSNKNVTKADLEALLERAGWDIAIRGECTPSDFRAGLGRVCAASGEIEKYYVEVILNKSSSEPGKTEIILFLRES